MSLSSLSLLSLALPSRVVQKRRCQRCHFVQPQGQTPEQEKARDFWLSSESSRSWHLNFGGEEQSILSRHKMTPGTAVSLCHSTALLPLLCFYGALPTVITWRFAHVSLSSKAKCYLYISTEFMTLLQLFFLHITKDILKLFPTISSPRKLWEHLHEQIQIHECSVRLQPKCLIFEVWTVR